MRTAARRAVDPLRANYDKWQPPQQWVRLTRMDVSDRGVAHDALAELDRAEASGSEEAFAAWARKWARPALSTLLGRSL